VVRTWEQMEGRMMGRSQPELVLFLFKNVLFSLIVLHLWRHGRRVSCNASIGGSSFCDDDEWEQEISAFLKSIAHFRLELHHPIQDPTFPSNISSTYGGGGELG